MLELKQSDIAVLDKQFGIKYPAGAKILDNRAKMALDADYIGGTAQTVANGGVPALLTTWIDPALIEVVLSPVKMAEVFGEVQKGTRTDFQIMFPMVEQSGFVSTYDDYNDNGTAGANVNYEHRQPYEYQTTINIGEKEIEIMAAGKVDWVSQKQQAAQMVLNRFQNFTYLYGVAGLKNYGMLNDPSLLPAITGTNWAVATADEIFVQIGSIYSQLVTQGKGNVKRTDNMTMVLSPVMDSHLTKTNQFGLNVYDLIKKNFPNLKIEIVPEYTTDAGENIQLILDSYMGRKTAEMAFTEKMRTGPIINAMSSWKQKRSQTTLGAIIYRPVFVVSYLGSSDPTP